MQIGQLTWLDPTDGFNAAPGTSLRVVWSWESRPSASVASFDNPNALRPAFTADIDGTYIALARFYAASDVAGTTLLHEVRVVAGTGNLPPVAKVHARGLPGGTSPLTLDATGSFDVDGDQLTYLWEIENGPAGTAATISNAAAATTQIGFTVPGTYMVKLTVQDSDGLVAAPARYSFAYTASPAARQSAPVASFGLDQIATTLGQAVVLEPYSSTDIDGDFLTTTMGILSAPAGSTAALTALGNGQQRFVPIVAGDYLIALSVSDGARTSYDQILVVAGSGSGAVADGRPVARIGAVSTAVVGTALKLSGAQSYDHDGDALTYSWALLTRPTGSMAALATPGAVEAGFTPDVPGSYVVQLLVEDRSQASRPVTLRIDVATPLPVAIAGPDKTFANGATVQLDGGLSTSATTITSYRWNLLGLTGTPKANMSLTTVGTSPLAQFTSITRSPNDIQVAQFQNVLKTTDVYADWDYNDQWIGVPRPADGNLCRFALWQRFDETPADFVPDTRPLDQAKGDVPPAFDSPGYVTDAAGVKWVIWRVSQQRGPTRVMKIQLANGTWSREFVLLGGVDAFIRAPYSTSQAKLFVNGTQWRQAAPNLNPFQRTEPVCLDKVENGPVSSVLQLIVADAPGISLPDTVFVGNGNLRPVLIERPRLVAAAGASVSLSAADYVSDANGDALTHGWSLLLRPEGSTAAVFATPGQKVVAGPTLSFTPDRSGLYLIQLTAADASLGAAPVIIEIEVPNAAPLAIAAGPGQVFVGETATFDGTGSNDPDGNALSYLWQIQSAPAGSAAALSGATAPIATLVPDRSGTYVVSLVVSDYALSSDPVTLTLEVPNRAPIANLAAPADIVVGEEVQLSAAGSSDPDGDALSYTYAVVSAPSGSTAEIIQSGPTSAAFVADKPGDYRLAVTVSDGIAQATAEVLLTARTPNTSPVLADLDPTYTVELGLRLHLQLQGSDPDGSPINYFATPLPLPAGMTLNAATGLVSFRPELGQEGTYAFTFGVSDGVRTDTQAITLNVVPADAGDTALTGRVLDAVDFANGIETPLAGMPVRLRDSALATVTDAQGQFTFGSLTRLSDVVLVEPSATGGPGGYIGSARSVRITTNQIRDIDPDILLTALNDGCATVAAGTPTLLVGAQSGVSVTVPADSVKTSTGAAYTGHICLGSLPQLFADPGLPQDTQACHIYALAAPGAVFTQPLAVSAPNADLLPEQTKLELWGMAGTATEFSRAAFAGVDSGGGTVSGQLTTTGDGALFSFLPQPPLTIAAADMPTGNTSLTPFTGDVSETYVLPGYRAFNQDQQIALSYHSKAADPTVIAAGEVTLEADASLPLHLSTAIRIGGLSIMDDAEWTPRLRADGYVPAIVGEAVSLRQSLPIDATSLSSGRYKYDFVAKAKYACSTVASSHEAILPVQNAATSPFGNGWSIDSLQRLVLGEDGSASIIDDDGIATFEPKTALTEFDENPLVFPAIGTRSVSVLDYDGDGILDVTYAESGTGSAGLIRGLGGRNMEFDRVVTFANPNNVPTTGGYAPNLMYLSIGDVNNDSVPDIGYALQFERIAGYLANGGMGTFTETPVARAGGASYLPSDLRIIDIDADGYNDFVFLDTSSNTTKRVIVAYGTATGLQPGVVVASAAQSGLALQLEVADIDADGRLDIAYRGGSTALTFFFQTANRTFTGVVQSPALGPSPLPNTLDSFFKLADFNGDGKKDVIWSGTDNLTVYLNRNTTGRNFLSGVVLPRPPFAGTFLKTYIADANDDGFDDIVTSSSDVAVYISNGDGTFQPFETGLVDYPLDSVAFADLDGDGNLDMVSGQTFSVTVHFSKPAGTGGFKSGKGEYSSLSRLPDGTFERRYKDGMKVLFDAAGRQTAELDAQGNTRSFAYNPNGTLARITDQVGGVTEFLYEPALNRLSLIRYPDGRETTFSYDDLGNLGVITEPTGGTVSFAYDDNNRLIRTTNQNGNTTSYTYDATGQLNGATLPDGSSIRNQVAASLGLVDGLGNALPSPLPFIPEDQRTTKVTDRKGQITEIIVNEFGSILQVTDPIGRVTTIERDIGNLAVRVERPSAEGGVRVDLIEYDPLANVTRMVEAAGTPSERDTLYEYEPIYSKVTRMVDPDGFATLYEYDSSGLVTEITDPGEGDSPGEEGGGTSTGGVRTYTYTPEGLLASRTDQNGNVTTYSYKPDSKNLDTITYADGSVTGFTYDSRGNKTIVVEASGLPEERRIIRTFDSLNRVLTEETTGPDGLQIGGITTYTYDTAGNVKTVTDETGLVTTMTYDSLERLIALDDPAEGLIRRSYNAAGEVTEHINGDNEVHLYTYDTVSRLIGTTDPEGYAKSFVYDVGDNVTSVIDGRDGETTFTYDVLNRMIGRTNPLGLSIGREYDSRDNLVTLTREDGLTETATYDGLGRRIAVETPDNSLFYAFDPVGNLTSAQDNDSRVTFTWDNRNRILSTTTDGTFGPQPEVTLTYAYDALDRRTAMTDSLGGTTAYDWDVESRLATLTAPWGTDWTFGYDGEGRRTSLTSSTGRVTTYGYTNSLLTALSHAQAGVTLTDLSFAYGEDGQLTAIIDNLDLTRSEVYTYDALNRLLQVAQGLPVSQGGAPIPVEDYAYDQEGNRTASHLSFVHVSSDHNQILEDDSYTYGYDDRGNRIERISKATGDMESYSYDSQNRLIGYISPTTEASYAYDALDRRIAKVVDGVTEAYVYDAWGMASTSNEVVLDFTDAALTRRWLHGPGVDEPLAFLDVVGAGGTAYDLHADRQGSILRVVDPATGTIAAEYDYDSFGNRATTGTLDQRYAFTGREADGESGLLYFRARHYDPLTGMFLQRDPIGFAAGDLNLYAYTWNNPGNWTDPSGLAVAIDYGANGLRSGAAAGAGFGGLFGAIRNLAIRIAKELSISAMSGAPDDAGDDAGAGDEAGPGDPECNPTDPLCEEEPEECVDPSQAAGEPTDHFNERLAERGGTGPDWNEIIAKGTRHYDTKYGTTVYGYQGWQVSVLPDGRPNSIQPQRSNSTNNRVKSGRYKPC